MTVTVDGTQGVTTPKLTIIGTGAVNNILPATAAGTFNYTLPAGNGTLLLSAVNLTFPATVGLPGQVLTADGSGGTTWGLGGLNVGTTAIASGTTGSILIDTAGVLQQIVMGGGVAAALAAGTNSPNGFMVANASGVLDPTKGGTGLSAIGTPGQVLTVNGAGTGLAWQPNTGTPGGGNSQVQFNSGGSFSANSDFTYNGAGQITLGGAAGGKVVLSGSTSGTATIGVPAAAGSTVFNFPATSGLVSQVLNTDGSGNAGWVNGKVTVGTTDIALGASTLTIGGLTTLTLTQDPVNAFEASTKGYVDAATAAVNRAAPVDAATTANIALSGLQTIDTVTLTAGQRVLVKNQTLPAENGIYDAAAGPWTRAVDESTFTDLIAAIVYVNGGGQSGTSWIQTAPGPGTINVTANNWAIQSSPLNYLAGPGISITLGTTINNTGVLSVSGGTTGLTFDNSTGACTLQGQLALSTGVAGTLPFANGGTGLNTLGTAGQVLTVNPAATALVWQTPSGGGGSLTVGTTAIASGTTGSILIDTSGVLQQITMGTGVASALAQNANSANGLMVANASGVLDPTKGGTGLSALGAGVQSALGNATNSANGIMVANASGVLDPTEGGTGLSALGTAGQVLTVNPAATALVWQTPSGGGPATLTIGTSAINGGTTGTILINTSNVLQQLLMGTGVSAALAQNANSANGLMVANASGVLDIAKGGTGLSALGTGVQSALGNATNSANGLAVLNGSGALPIANGGTGQVTANDAFNALAPSQSGNVGKYLTTDGTNTSWAVAGSGLAVGTTAITSGTSGRVLYDNAGVLGELTVTGTGNAVLATSPAVTTPVLTGLNETQVSITTGAATINCAAGNVFSVSLSASITGITFSNVPTSGTAYSFTLSVTSSGGGQTITWPGSFKWPSGTAPTITNTNGKVDTFVCYTFDAGTTWYAFTAGQNA